MTVTGVGFLGFGYGLYVLSAGGALILLAVLRVVGRMVHDAPSGD